MFNFSRKVNGTHVIYKIKIELYYNYKNKYMF